MFKNIGKKIKGLVTVIAVIGIIASVIGGIATAMLLLNNGAQPAIALISALVIIAVGCFVSIIGSWFTYGYGELIDKTAETAELLRRMSGSSSASPRANSAVTEDDLATRIGGFND